jgi:hypothetical protein
MRVTTRADRVRHGSARLGSARQELESKKELEYWELAQSDSEDPRFKVTTTALTLFLRRR